MIKNYYSALLPFSCGIFTHIVNDLSIMFLVFYSVICMMVYLNCDVSEIMSGCRQKNCEELMPINVYKINLQVFTCLYNSDVVIHYTFNHTYLLYILSANNGTSVL